VRLLRDDPRQRGGGRRGPSGSPIDPTGCTLNFAFRGSDDRLYIASAGHCFVDDGVEQAWPAGSGAVVQSGLGANPRIGELA